MYHYAIMYKFHSFLNKMYSLINTFIPDDAINSFHHSSKTIRLPTWWTLFFIYGSSLELFPKDDEQMKIDLSPIDHFVHLW